MTLRLPPTSRALKTLLAALIGIGSGLVAARIGMPLPWMLGPMLGCGAAALAGAPVFGPTSLRPVVMPVIGVMLGASFHPGLFAHAGEWIGTLLLLPAFLVVATAATFAFYRLVGGYRGSMPSSAPPRASSTRWSSSAGRPAATRGGSRSP